MILLLQGLIFVLMLWLVICLIIKWLELLIGDN